MKYQPPTVSSHFLLLLMRLQHRRHQESGFAMVATTAMLVLLTALLLTAAILSKVDTASTRASANSSRGFSAAEAGLNIRAQAIRNTFEGYNRPTGDAPKTWEDCVDTGTGNDGTEDFICETVTFTTDDKSTLQDQTVVTLVQEDAANPSFVTVPEGELFAGLSAQEYRYDLVSVARDNEDLPSAILGMRFKSRLVPLFQFAAFYDKDLEILPGPPMNLNGPVHTNGDLYLNAGTNLNINGQVSTANDLYRGRKNGDSCGGAVNVYDPNIPLGMGCGVGRTQITNVDPWNNEVRIDIEALDVPPIEALDADPNDPEAVYWQQADLRLVLEVDGSGNPSDLDGNGTYIEVRNPNGTRDSSATNALLGQCDGPEVNIAAQPDDDDDGQANTYETDDVEIKVSSSDLDEFRVGDIVRAGDDDDSNVILNIDTDDNIITLKRRIGHSSYQSTPVVSAGDKLNKAVVATSNTFYNYREAKPIRMLDVDVQGLLTCLDANGNGADQNLLQDGRALDDSTQGGLVWFLTVEGADSDVDVTNGSPDGNNYGIRLYNGAELTSTDGSAPDIRGLTVVSDQALYVVGDYNSVNKKPAAFLGDSLNVLSNNWHFAQQLATHPTAEGAFDGRLYTNNLPNGGTTLADRAVTQDTTINAAFLSGTDITGEVEGSAGQSNPYNGGLENYPRFHEQWSGRTLTYRGSFVSLNKARRVDGRWETQSYSPPNRDWDYDTDFNDASKLPPLTPRLVYLVQELFDRDFERTVHRSPANDAATFSAKINGLMSVATVQPRFFF